MGWTPLTIGLTSQINLEILLPDEMRLLAVFRLESEKKTYALLFTAALTDLGHVLIPLLPSAKTLTYSIRPRQRDRIVPQADNLMRTFLNNNAL